MDSDDVSQTWSKRFGLAVSPLFEADEVPDPKSHHVFLDGGQGTFALSVTDEDGWKDGQKAAWAWSSDIAITLRSLLQKWPSFGGTIRLIPLYSLAAPSTETSTSFTSSLPRIG